MSHFFFFFLQSHDGLHHLVEVAEYLFGLGRDIYLLVWIGRWALKCLTAKDVREVSMTQAMAKMC